MQKMSSSRANNYGTK